MAQGNIGACMKSHQLDAMQMDPPNHPTRTKDDKIMLAAVLVAGTLARLALLHSGSLQSSIQSFVPLNTSTGSWRRFSEGLFLYTHNMPLYDNDVFHQSPLFLPVFALIPACCHPYLFILFDLLIATALNMIAHRQPILEPLTHLPATSPSSKRNNNNNNNNTAPIDRGGGGIDWSPTYIALAYLLNPLSLISCLSMDMGYIERVCVALGAAAASHGDSIWSSLALAIAFQHGGGLHTLCYIPILALIQRRATQLSGMALIPGMTIQVGAWLGVFAMLYVQVMGLQVSQIAKATIGFGLNVTDLAPNIGVWWYFLQEVFDHFRDLFVFVFQFHVLLYLVPVLMRFGKELPIFSLNIYLGVTATLRAYPAVGDYALWFGFIPLFANTWKYFRYSFISLTLFFFTSLLFPTMYLLYAHLHSGNANFPYALTLLVCAAATMLQSDILHGMLVRTHAATVTHEVKLAVEQAALEMEDESDQEEEQEEEQEEGDALCASREEDGLSEDVGELRRRAGATVTQGGKPPRVSWKPQPAKIAEIEPLGDYPSVIMYFEG